MARIGALLRPTAIAVGLFLGKDRNWALVALGGLGVYLARGGTVSAEAIRQIEVPDLPSFEKLRELYPGAPQSL